MGHPWCFQQLFTQHSEPISKSSRCHYIVNVSLINIPWNQISIVRPHFPNLVSFVGVNFTASARQSLPKGGAAFDFQGMRFGTFPARPKCAVKSNIFAPSANIAWIFHLTLRSYIQKNYIHTYIYNLKPVYHELLRKLTRKVRFSKQHTLTRISWSTVPAREGTCIAKG